MSWDARHPARDLAFFSSGDVSRKEFSMRISPGLFAGVSY
jgi:hypothetical protein